MDVSGKGGKGTKGGVSDSGKERLREMLISLPKGPSISIIAREHIPLQPKYILAN